MARLFGITGLIGSGKSSAARWVAAAGFPVLDADREAHRLYAEDAALRQAIAEVFGSQVLVPGGVDRVYLASRVFADPQALIRLEALVHPVLRRHIDARAAELQSSSLSGSDIVFLEAALLCKWPDMIARMAEIWMVECPEEVRLQRLISRGLSEEDARNRIEVQRHLPLLDQAWVKRIDNSGSLHAFQSQVEFLLKEVV